MTIKKSRGLFRNMRKSKIGEHHQDDADDDEERESNLEVKFFSVKTFWYLVGEARHLR
jgi:hypothetical protein